MSEVCKYYSFDETRLQFKSVKEKELYFINDFKKYEKEDVLNKTFTQGYCYYFALILKDRFDGSIYFDSNVGHFITKIGRDYYDITGCVSEKYKGKVLYPKEEWMNMVSVVNGCILKHI